MPATRKTLIHDYGTTFNLGIVYKDSNRVPVNLTGHTVTFNVYGTDRSGSFRLPATSAVVDGAGHITIKVAAEDTAKWGAGRLNYEVIHREPNGDVERMFYGPLDIKGAEA